MFPYFFSGWPRDDGDGARDGGTSSWGRHHHLGRRLAPRQVTEDDDGCSLTLMFNFFASLFHVAIFPCSYTRVWWLENWKLAKDWICSQVPNNNQRAWRLPWGWHRLPPQQGRTWRFRKTAHQVSLVPTDTIFVRWLAQLGENTW